MSMFTLYLVTMLDNFKDILDVLFIITLCSVGLWLVVALCWAAIQAEDRNMEDDVKYVGPKALFANHWKKAIIFIVLFATVPKLVPTTKQVAFIYIVGTITQNDEVKNFGATALKKSAKIGGNMLDGADQMTQVPDKAFQILNGYLKGYLQDMEAELAKESKALLKEGVSGAKSAVKDTVNKATE